MGIFPTRILLGTDGSEEADLATRNAVELADSTNSELHMVHVGQVPNFLVNESGVCHVLAVSCTRTRAGGPRSAQEPASLLHYPPIFREVASSEVRWLVSASAGRTLP